MTQSKTYLSLKLASARKAGQRSTDDITYRVLTDEQRQDLFITIVANKSSGYFSREIVPLAAIELCLNGIPKDQPLSARIFRSAFIGKSVNNAGFLAALLKAEGLLTPSTKVAHQHQVSGDWADWKANMLTREGEVYVPPAKDVPTATSQAQATPTAPEDAQAKSQPRRKGRKALAGEATSHEESDDDRTS